MSLLIFTYPLQEEKEAQHAEPHPPEKNTAELLV